MTNTPPIHSKCCDQCAKTHLTVPVAFAFCPCHQQQEKNVLTDITPERLKELEDGGAIITRIDHPKTEDEEVIQKGLDKLYGTPTESSWEEELRLGGEIIDFEGDLCRDGVQKLKAFIKAEKIKSYKNGVHDGELQARTGAWYQGYADGRIAGKQEGLKRALEVLNQYFKGLVIIPMPQLTYQSLRDALEAELSANKKPQ